MVSSHIKRFACIKKKDHSKDNYMLRKSKCHCLTAWTPAFNLDHHIKTGTAEIRDSAGKSPKHWGHRTDLGQSKKGNCRKYLQRFRRLHLFSLETKNTHTHNYKTHTQTIIYIWELHVSFRIHEGVNNASEVDSPFLNMDKQMELTTTVSDRQTLGAAVITAEIKQQRTHGIKDMDELQSEIQKYSYAHCAVLKDVFQLIDICGHTCKMISVQHPW